MRALWGTLSEALERHHAVGLVTVTRVRGSGPREPGARMIVLPDGDIRGTIGGGTLEFQALQIARDAVNARKSKRLWRSFALGPDLGQCCGGAVEVLIEAFTSLDLRTIQGFADAEAAGEFALRSSKSSGAPTRVIAEYGGGDTIQLDGDTLIESFSSDDTPVAIFGAGHVGRALVL
ncbi:MAG: XdhC family protein, partial [Pseudomonadota bacterium]